MYRFNGEEFLVRNKGKKIMFVGDSLSSNQWQSLVCMLYNHARLIIPSIIHGGSISTVSFPVSPHTSLENIKKIK